MISFEEYYRNEELRMVNYELERLILSYGESVKVVPPEHLKNKILTQLTNAIDNY